LEGEFVGARVRVLVQRADRPGHASIVVAVRALGDTQRIVIGVIGVIGDCPGMTCRERRCRSSSALQEPSRHEKRAHRVS
jgi:hypothetical protein